MMSELLAQYSSGTTLFSALIRTVCNSEFSHVDIMLPGEGLLGASGKDDSLKDPGGIRLRPFNPWPYHAPPKVARILASETTVRAIVEAGRSQLGKPFDNDGVHRFLGRGKGCPDWDAVGQWWCSEWFVWSCRQGNLYPYTLVVTKDHVSPQDSLIINNPFMAEDNIKEFLL